MIDEFFNHDADELTRSQLLEAISGRSDGECYFTYNAFNVRLDFDKGEATVEDELDAGRERSVGLLEFVRRLRG